MENEDLARAHREANPSVASAEQPVAPEPAAPDGQPKATLGPLGAFFKRRAEFFEGEATMLAIALERLAQAGGAGKE
jgi:hypothetical protein